MQRNIAIFLTFFFILLVYAGQPAETHAQVGDAWALISEVNALRASYGLAPYEVNNSLMSAAQKHSDYQAQIGTWTHTGPGGSRPHDRAVAAGYGGGAQVFVSENVAMGINLSPHDTVYEMWQDAIHLETMISSQYKHIGAGVGISGNSVYYTIDVGYIAGSPGGGNGDPPGDDPPPGGDGGTLAPTAIPLVPIVVSTPGPDGTIYHVVQWGQFLENIAKAYEKPLNDLLNLNGLTNETIIYPGDKLLINPGRTPEGPQGREIAPTEEETEQPAFTPRSTRTSNPITGTETPMPVAMDLAMESSATADASVEVAKSPENERRNSDYLLYAVFGLAITGTAMILLGSALKRRS
jgi:LysM repeat protein